MPSGLNTVKYSQFCDKYCTLYRYVLSDLELKIFYRKTKPDGPPKYNEIDGKVDRRSFCGKYTIEDNGVPRYV